MTMTAAVESLHATYPDWFLTDVRTPVPAIWEHNPHITPISDFDGESLQLEYPSIHRSNQASVSFLEGYTEHLGALLGLTLRLTTNRPHLYLSEAERKWTNQVEDGCFPELAGRKMRFWLIDAGVKRDFTCKQWPVEHYQAVVDGTMGRIQWVQIGAKEHNHPALRGVLDLRGKTDQRQLIRLAYHAQGGLGPVTYLQHLMAAWERPYLCLVGGREPVTWVQYPFQMTFHQAGQLPCCRHGACWKSRVVPLGDGAKEDHSLCERPVLGGSRPTAQCMAMITPAEVLTVLNRMENLR
jgi:ADP-heptose:LPS heptosyltransferase